MIEQEDVGLHGEPDSEQRGDVVTSLVGVRRLHCLMTLLSGDFIRVNGRIMTGFVGFPSGKNPYVPVPEVFFTVLLPEIEDSAELKVTLHLFWMMAQKKGNPRWVSDRELLADRVL